MKIEKKLELFQLVIDRIYEDTKRPVCRLQLSEQPYSILDSHLGGVPYCPHEQQIPADEDGCKIGGYLAYEQWDPRHENNAPEWDILLLQLDDRDEAPDFYLGGYGISNFWIRTEDLKQRDFSNVGADWTTS